MRPSKIIWKDSLCCEPILRKTPFGLLLLVECGGGKEPDPDNKMLSFICDEGNIWKGPYEVWPEEEGAQCLMEVLVTDEWVYGFFSRHNGCCLKFCSVIRKTKDGINWVNADEFSINGRNTIFRGAAIGENGDILIPYQRYFLSEEDEQKLIAENKFLFSGLVTRVENGSVIFRDGKLISWSETPAVTKFPLPNGRKFIWTEAAALWKGFRSWKQLLRMDSTGVLYQIDSDDNGIHWSSPVPTDIPNPGSKVRLCPMNDREILLFHTPNTTKRNPLEVWYSNDGLKTFYKKVRLSSDERLYHYADTCITSGIINMVIERDRKEVLLYRINPNKLC